MIKENLILTEAVICSVQINNRFLIELWEIEDYDTNETYNYVRVFDSRFKTFTIARNSDIYNNPEKIYEAVVFEYSNII